MDEAMESLLTRVRAQKKFASKPPSQRQKIVEALGVLRALGLPIETKTPRKAETMAMALLAIADIGPDDEWQSAKCINDWCLGTREIIAWENEHYSEGRSPGSYDDIRREDLDWLALVDMAVSNGTGGKNAPNRKWGLSAEAAEAIKSFGTPQWDHSIKALLKGRPTLEERLHAPRPPQNYPVSVPGDVTLTLGPGGHNELIRDVIEKFLPQFGHGAEVLYVGDADDRDLYKDDHRLNELGVFEIAVDELPDVVAYSDGKQWLFIIEAVFSTGPVSREKHLKYQDLLKGRDLQVVYVTAFKDRASFKKWAHDVAWETEVWLSDEPTHLIHYNGDKFLGPHNVN